MLVWYASFIYVTQYHVVPKSLDIAKHQRVNDRLAGKIHLIFADQWKGKSLTVRSNELFVPNQWTGNRLPSAGQPFTLLSRALDLSAKGDRDEIWRMHCNEKLLKSQFIILSKEREVNSPPSEIKARAVLWSSNVQYFSLTNCASKGNWGRYSKLCLQKM